MRALVDTGADQTFVPQRTIAALGLQLITDDLEIHDGTGKTTPGELYRAHLEFEGVTFTNLAVAATDYPVVIVGRDIINGFVATFDGPAGEFELVRP